MLSDYTWDDFPIRTEPVSIADDQPRQRIVSIAGTRYLELPDNGWELLFAWRAGPRRACRRADATEHTVTSTRRARGDTPQSTTVEARADEDWATIDGFVNSYLHDAGVPPRPRGFTWYLELPAGRTPGDVWNTVSVASARSGPLHPRDVRDAMTVAITDLYSSD